MTQRPRPLESFGPEVMAALLRGAISPVTIQMSYRDASRFRQRAYQLRVAMKKIDHPKYPIVALARITIEWPPATPVTTTSRGVKFPSNKSTPCTVTIAPQDSEFAAAIKQAGVDLGIGTLDHHKQEAAESEPTPQHEPESKLTPLDEFWKEPLK